eukprot:6476680-Amphidinium_carterae.6
MFLFTTQLPQQYFAGVWNSVGKKQILQFGALCASFVGLSQRTRNSFWNLLDVQLWTTIVGCVQGLTNAGPYACNAVPVCSLDISLSWHKLSLPRKTLQTLHSLEDVFWAGPNLQATQTKHNLKSMLPCHEGTFSTRMLTRGASVSALQVWLVRILTNALTCHSGMTGRTGSSQSRKCKGSKVANAT